MNDETKTTRPPASLEDGCERMKSRLQEAAIEIAQALESAEGAERTGERWQLLSRGLGKAQNALGLDGWQKTIGRTWHDPAADIPPIAEPINPNAPKMVRSWPEAFDIPELGIYWRRFYTPKYVHIIAAWNNGQDAHVYQMTVRPLASGERWHVDVTNDGGTVFTMESDSKCLAERCGLSAMRAYIIRGHRKTWRRVHAAEDAAEAAEPQREVS